MDKEESEKIKNIIELFKTFGEILKQMPDSDLKKEFKAFVYSLMNSRKPINVFLDEVNNKIKEVKKVENQNSKTVDKNIVRFWENMRDLIIDTYKKNTK